MDYDSDKLIRSTPKQRNNIQQLMKSFLLGTINMQENYQAVEETVFVGYKLYFVKCMLTDDMGQLRNYYRDTVFQQLDKPARDSFN